MVTLALKLEVSFNKHEIISFNGKYSELVFVVAEQLENKMLTEKQIKNWRNILSLQFGPWALIMPVEEIEKIKENMEKSFNKEEQNEENLD